MMSKPHLSISPFDGYMLVVIAVLLLGIAGVVISGDHIGVQILDVNPVNGAVAPYSSRIQIVFDQPMDQRSVERHFSIEPTITGAFTWRSTTMIFTPDFPLTPSQQYNITVNPGAKSTTGRELNEAYQWSFVTQAAIAYYLYPSNAVERGLWAVSTADAVPYEVYTPQYGIVHFAPSPDGTQIAVTGYGEDLAVDIWLIEADGSNPRQLTHCAPEACGQAAWSPDGSLLAYEYYPLGESVAPGPSRIWLMDIESGETAPVFEDNQVLGYWATWSPRGHLLSFYDSNAGGIRIVNLQTQAEFLIETDMPDYWSFTPDSSAIAYTDRRQDNQEYLAQLWTADLTDADNGHQPLLAESQEDQEPVWSPDGTLLAFRRRLFNGSAGSGWQLMIYDPATTELHQATADDNYTCRDIRWHPGGRFILMQRYNLNTGYSAEIWLYDVKNKYLRQITRDGFMPTWLPS